MNSVLTIRPVDWHLDDYSFFQKCGEISVSPDIQSFGINCRFCEGFCLKFEIFVNHLRDSHQQDIFNLYNITVINDDITNLPEILPILENSHENSENNQINLAHDPNESEKSDLIQLTTLENSFDLNANPLNEINQFYTYPLESPSTITSGPSSVSVSSSKDESFYDASSSFETDTPDNNQIINEEVNVIDLVNSFNVQVDQHMTNVQTEEPKNEIPPERDSEQKRIVGHNPKEVSKYINSQKDVVSYLIEAYKMREHLWNPNHKEYKRNARHNLFKDLSENLFRDLNFLMTANDVSDMINLLRNRFTHEIKKAKALDNPNDYVSTLWCFQDLMFLKDIIKNKNPAKKQKVVSEDSTTSPASTYRSMDKDLLGYLLRCYEAEPALWNTKHPSYSRERKKTLFEEMSKKIFEDVQIVISGEEIANEIEKLRIRYRRELRFVFEHKGLYVSKLWFFDRMSFLEPIFNEQILKKVEKRRGFHSSRKKPKIAHIQPINFDTPQQFEQFVEIFRTHPALWNVDHPDYRSTTFREKALSQMLYEVNKTFYLTSSLEELERTISVFRRKYAEDKLVRINNSEENIESSETLLYYEFIDNHIGPFKCDVCSEIVNTSDQFKIHKSGHDGQQPFICTICGKGFQMPGNLTVHIRRHKGDFPYSCNECDKTFATSTEVIIHRRTHTGERPYSCDVCQKSYKTWSFYDIHRRTHLNQSTFHCPICDKGFYEKNRYTDHMNGHLNIRQHLCNVCGKSFTTYGNLRKHNDLHSLVKKYKCPHCGKRFAQYAGLRWHKRKYHATEEPVKENEE